MYGVYTVIISKWFGAIIFDRVGSFDFFDTWLQKFR